MINGKRHVPAGCCIYAGIACLLSACNDVPVLEPRGPVGTAEQFVIGISLGLMLLVVVPAIFLSLWFSRRYNAKRPKGDYAPGWTYSAKIDLAIWVIPILIITGLGTIAWKESHRLDPGRPLDALVKPLTIQVIALDWKWLFVYPQQDVATVSQLTLPDDMPIRFRLTSASVIASFFIPQLGSQIYVMPGRMSTLHLIAHGPGEYFGQNEQLSGLGYSEMHFKVHVLTKDKFAAWIKQAKQSPEKLDISGFQYLSRPTLGYPATTYSAVEFPLFRDIAAKYQTVKNLSSSNFRKPGGTAHEQ